MGSIKSKDRIGKKFNKLTVLGITGENKSADAFFECICDCGNICNVLGVNIFGYKSSTKSCGCLKIGENNNLFSHGDSQPKSKNYRLYQSVIEHKRVCKEKSLTFQKEWNDFRVFLKDMGSRPSNVLLSRIDLSKGFVRGNIEYRNKRKS